MSSKEGIFLFLRKVVDSGPGRSVDLFGEYEKDFGSVVDLDKLALKYDFGHLSDISPQLKVPIAIISEVISFLDNLVYNFKFNLRYKIEITLCSLHIIMEIVQKEYFDTSNSFYLQGAFVKMNAVPIVAKALDCITTLGPHNVGKNVDTILNKYFKTVLWAFSVIRAFSLVLCRDRVNISIGFDISRCYIESLRNCNYIAIMSRVCCTLSEHLSCDTSTLCLESLFLTLWGLFKFLCTDVSPVIVDASIDSIDAFTESCSMLLKQYLQTSYPQFLPPLVSFIQCFLSASKYYSKTCGIDLWSDLILERNMDLCFCQCLSRLEDQKNIHVFIRMIANLFELRTANSNSQIRSSKFHFGLRLSFLELVDCFPRIILNHRISSKYLSIWYHIFLTIFTERDVTECLVRTLLFVRKNKTTVGSPSSVPSIKWIVSEYFIMLQQFLLALNVGLASNVDSESMVVESLLVLVLLLESFVKEGKRLQSVDQQFKKDQPVFSKDMNSDSVRKRVRLPESNEDDKGSPVNENVESDIKRSIISSNIIKLFEIHVQLWHPLENSNRVPLFSTIDIVCSKYAGSETVQRLVFKVKKLVDELGNPNNQSITNFSIPWWWSVVSSCRDSPCASYFDDDIDTNIPIEAALSGNESSDDLDTSVPSSSILTKNEESSSSSDSCRKRKIATLAFRRLCSSCCDNDFPISLQRE